MSEKVILWIDDDIYPLYPYVLKLEDDGYQVHLVSTTREVKTLLNQQRISLVVMDVMFNPSDLFDIGYNPSEIQTKGGFHSGLVLGRWIKRTFPKLPIVGFSASRDDEVVDWFTQRAAGYITKFQLGNIEDVIRYMEAVANGEIGGQRLKVFIVHGHDDKLKYETKNFIQNSLGLGEPIILHEQPSSGRTIFEKLEDLAKEVNLVFVLLTPDDVIHSKNISKPHSRARQNVILELGYFLAKLPRKTGRVILLYKGELELPSDINGIVYIDVTNGIEASAETIRREVSEILNSRFAIGSR